MEAPGAPAPEPARSRSPHHHRTRGGPRLDRVLSSCGTTASAFLFDPRSIRDAKSSRGLVAQAMTRWVTPGAGRPRARPRPAARNGAREGRHASRGYRRCGRQPQSADDRRPDGFALNGIAGSWASGNRRRGRCRVATTGLTRRPYLQGGRTNLRLIRRTRPPLRAAGRRTLEGLDPRRGAYRSGVSDFEGIRVDVFGSMTRSLPPNNASRHWSCSCASAPPFMRVPISNPTRSLCRSMRASSLS